MSKFDRRETKRFSGTSPVRACMTGFPAALTDSLRRIILEIPEIELYFDSRSPAAERIDFDLVIMDETRARHVTPNENAPCIRVSHPELAQIHAAGSYGHGVPDRARDTHIEKLVDNQTRRLLRLIKTQTSSDNSGFFFRSSREDLPQGLSLQELIEFCITYRRRNSENLGLMLVSIDSLAGGNGAWDNQVRERLLDIARTRIGRFVRYYDHVTRTGESEFSVVLRGLHDDGRTDNIAAKILKVLLSPISLEGERYFLSASIGISQYPGDSDGPVSLLRHARTALKRAQDLGGNIHETYDPGISGRLTRRWTLEQKLRLAVDREEFRLNYHPIVTPSTGDIVGLEALLRWQDPERGEVFPDEFIPVLEETGMIMPVGEWVMYQACLQIAEWQQEYGLSLLASINLSPAQLEDRDLNKKLQRAMSASRIMPDKVQLELTENVLLAHSPELMRSLKAIGETGATLCIDDFGTGFSSMSYLKRLPVSGLKIDKSFINGLPRDPSDRAITQSILDLGRNMGLKVVPEGVETLEQAQYLASRGADYLQGYFFSRPLPAREMGKLLASGGDISTGYGESTIFTDISQPTSEPGQH